jgi:hypothetical protein
MAAIVGRELAEAETAVVIGIDELLKFSLSKVDSVRCECPFQAEQADEGTGLDRIKNTRQEFGSSQGAIVLS